MRAPLSLRRRGMILILSSPSGAGKTTLTRMLLQDKALDLTLSISVTTRARRSSEADGIHYHFIDRRQYERMKPSGELLEAAEVHGNGYGTPRTPVEEVLALGRDMLFDIDWQGARQVREALGARRRQRLHPAALDAGTARAGSSAAPRIPRPPSARGWKTPSARSNAGGSTIMSSSTTICSAPIARSSRSSRPSGPGGARRRGRRRFRRQAARRLKLSLRSRPSAPGRHGRRRRGNRRARRVWAGNRRRRLPSQGGNSRRFRRP